jgi:hypothetical protein
MSRNQMMVVAAVVIVVLAIIGLLLSLKSRVICALLNHAFMLVGLAACAFPCSFSASVPCELPVDVGHPAARHHLAPA